MIWRHDGAFGNSAEQVIGLAQSLEKNISQATSVVVQYEWQRTMVRLVPSLRMVPVELDYESGKLLDSVDVCVPDVYRQLNSYTASWERLLQQRSQLLFLDGSLEIKFDLLLMFKSRNFQHTTESKRFDSHRYVDERRYHRLALDLARKGLRIARIGGPEQSKMPEHPNITDLAGLDKTLQTDFQALNSSRVTLFTDSGLWPIAIGLGKSTIVADIVSDQGSFSQVPFVPGLHLRRGRGSTNVFKWAEGPDRTFLRKRRICLGPVCVFIPVSTKALIEAINIALSGGASPSQLSPNR